MEKLQLYYPVNPHKINRAWGVPDPLYKQFGFDRHNGVDLNLINGQQIFAPIHSSVINVGNQPNGSGIFVSIISDDQYQFDDGKSAYVLLEFFHCQKILVNIGDTVMVGQPIALGDNTGCTTGSHTHMQPRRMNLSQVADTAGISAYRIRNVNYALMPVDINDANNTFDPESYWNKQYANQDTTAQAAKLQQMIQTLNQKLQELRQARGIK